MRKYLRWFLLGLGGLVIILIILPFVFPTDVYKSQIIAQAKLATGRDLAIDGPLSLTLYPEFGVEVEKVRFSNVPGAKQADMATMDKLVVGAELFPLLTGNLKITHIALVKTVIHLEVDAQGRGNWLFGPATEAAPQAGETPPAIAPSSGAGFSFQDMRLTDGLVTMSDARAGSAQEFSAINATVLLPSLDKPMTYEGSLAWNGETIQMQATVAEPRRLAEGSKSAVTAKVTGEVLAASFDGETDAATGETSGKVNFNTKSARRLAQWLGVSLPKVRGFGAMSLEGDMSSRAGHLAFKGARLTLDAMSGTGNLALDTTKEVPYAKGDFTLNRLDVNQYTGSGARDTSHGAATGAWSSAPIDASALRLVNADFDFAVNALEVGGLHIGRSALAIALSGGKLKARLRQLSLYGGNGTGTIGLDGTGAAPVLALDLKVDGVQGEPFLTDAAGFTRLSGTARIGVTVTGAGRSQAALMRSLAGKASISFTDGAIKGVNLAEIARTIQSALSGAAMGPGAKTDFAELSGSFAIRNGVAANKDLKLLNPFVRLTGAGVFDLGQQSLDYRVEPKAVKSIEGQGGKHDVAGIGIPFRVHGAWQKPSYEPDLSGVVNSAVDDILQGKNPLEDVGGIKDLFGGKKEPAPPADPNQPPEPKKKKPTPLDTINDLFGTKP